MQTYSAVKYKGPVVRANGPIFIANAILCDDIALWDDGLYGSLELK